MFIFEISNKKKYVGSSVDLVIIIEHYDKYPLKKIPWATDDNWRRNMES